MNAPTTILLNSSNNHSEHHEDTRRRAIGPQSHNATFEVIDVESENDHKSSTTANTSELEGLRTLRFENVAHNNTREEGTESVDDGHPRLRILLGCLLICLPIAIFTAILILLVLSHRIGTASCPYPNLCLTPSQLNQTRLASYYIVDFPAARLVFIASWSSTVSFTLITALMTLYGYTAAGQWLRLSDLDPPSKALPTPFQASLTVRVLNGELLTLGYILWSQIKRIFWERKKSEQTGSQQAVVFRGSVLVLAVAIAAR